MALAIDSPWTTTGDRRRQVIVVWTDQPAQPLDPSVLPADLAARVPADFSALTDVWEDEQGVMGSSSKRLILFAPDGPGWSDISAVWENVVHHPSQAGGGCPRSTTGRSSTRSATRCERSRGRLAARRHRAGPPGPTISFAFNLGKIPDQGEDSDPICATGRTSAWSRCSTGWAGPAAPSTRRRTGRVPAPTSRPGWPATWSNDGCSTCSNPTGTSTARRPRRTCSGRSSRR